jgi:predicted metal-binding membrane protein
MTLLAVAVAAYALAWASRLMLVVRRDERRQEA